MRTLHVLLLLAATAALASAEMLWDNGESCEDGTCYADINALRDREAASFYQQTHAVLGVIQELLGNNTMEVTDARGAFANIAARFASLEGQIAMLKSQLDACGACGPTPDPLSGILK
eukprot:m.286937 g.286937  ORF g.286937 m.286937 type:complete len:118 (+) comp11670_c0_seq1:4177-4530(+)